MQNDANPQDVAPQPAPMSAEEAAQFEQFKKQKLIEQTKARIAKTELDCLSPVLTRAQLKTLCTRAEDLALGGIVVLPAYVKTCVTFLGNDPKCSLIAPLGYPHGGENFRALLYAVKRAVKDGVDEVEVYAPMYVISEGNFNHLKRMCKKLVAKAKPRAVRMVFDCKIIESSALTRACACAADSGIADIRLINAKLAAITAVQSAVHGKCLIKSSANTLAEMEEAESAGVSIIDCRNALEVSAQMLASVE